MDFRHVGTIARSDEGGRAIGGELRAIAIDSGGRILVAADRHICVLSPAWQVIDTWKTDREPYCIAAAPDGAVCAGELRQIEICDSTGRFVSRWSDAGRLELPSAVAISVDSVFVSDARRPSILRYGRCGKFRTEIGKSNTGPGFLIPNGRLDFDLDRSGIIHAANPGKHRIERYSAEGELLGKFGKFDGCDPAGFAGCCNPTGVALLPGGGYVVSEKAPPRMKAYDAAGALVAHWGGELFDPLCKNLDIAVDSRGRIHVLDPVRMQIQVFEPGDPLKTKLPTTSAGVRP